MEFRSKDDLKRWLYHRMLFLRKCEEKIVSDYPLREMRSPPHLYMGHEAVAVGVCAALREQDVVYPYYRSHGWYLAKGGDLNAMIAELHGRETGCSKGWGGSMHLIDLKAGVMGTSAIVAGTISHAAGAALAFQMQKKDAVSVVSFGDGAIEEGVFHETLNFAALRKLPVLFVCENNLYATNTHIRDRQSQTDVYKRADAYAIPGVCSDGNDVLQVYEETAKAYERAKKGDGPTLLEFKTYRYLEHCGINEDLDLGYRSKAELDTWRAKDPLIKAKGFVSASEETKMTQEIGWQIEQAFIFARSSPFPENLFPKEVTNEV